MSLSHFKKERVEKLAAEWKAHPPLHESLPVAMPNGNKVKSFDGQCGLCDAEIAPDDMRGTVVFPVPTVATISAVGVCRRCSCLTPFVHRVRATENGLQSEWMTGKGVWMKKSWKPKRSLVTRLAGTAGFLVGRLMIWARGTGK